MRNQMSVTEARRLIVEGYALKFSAFVSVCDADCHALAITREQALAVVDHAGQYGDTVVAFLNCEAELCIG